MPHIMMRETAMPGPLAHARSRDPGNRKAPPHGRGLFVLRRGLPHAPPGAALLGGRLFGRLL